MSHDILLYIDIPHAIEIEHNFSAAVYISSKRGAFWLFGEHQIKMYTSHP
jgi:hypothetical protein